MVMYPRFRGLHELTRDSEGKIRCVACELCAAVCPARCIKVEPSEGPTHKRFPKVYEIDLGRCIFCGFCEEACPYGAVVLRGNYETANYSRKDLIYNRDQLLHSYDR